MTDKYAHSILTRNRHHVHLAVINEISGPGLNQHGQLAMTYCDKKFENFELAGDHWEYVNLSKMVICTACFPNYKKEQ